MKKLVSLILICTLLLCACEKQEPQQTQTVPSTAPAQTTDVPAPTTEAAETTEADPGPEGILEEKDTETLYLLTRAVRCDENGDPIWERTYEYDELGRMTEVLVYNEQNTLAYRTVYSGYEQNLYTRMDYYVYDADMAEILTDTQTFTYDDQGRVIYTELIAGDVVGSTSTYTYDEMGNILSQTNTLGELEHVLTYEYTYDTGGNILSAKEFQDGNLMGTREYSYDDAGKLASEAYFDYSGTLMNRTEITWEGATEARITCDTDGNPILSEITTYDESGNITMVESQNYGAVTMTEYTYEPFEIQK